jgi:hypothetical protein
MTDLETPITYEMLAAIEDEFEEIDSEILRKQYTISQSAYARRAEAISQIPNFWPLVLEQAPPEIDQFIQPRDSQILVESLINLEVIRPEIALGPEAIVASNNGGNPRSLRIKFEFKENEHFENEVLEKTFWYRRASDGWTGLVSEPVKINWKAGKDLTEGLTNMAVKLFDARKKSGGDFTKKDVPEYAALKKKAETANGMNTSFFTWFGFVSGRRYVSAEESEKAEKERDAKKAQSTEKTSEDALTGEDEAEANDDTEVEVHEAGEELAIAIAEDLWPGAIKYFTQAQEAEEMSDIDFEELQDLDEESEDGAPVDIRSLVQNGNANGRKASGGGPPSKKQKK